MSRQSAGCSSLRDRNGRSRLLSVGFYSLSASMDTNFKKCHQQEDVFVLVLVTGFLFSVSAAA